MNDEREKNMTSAMRKHGATLEITQGWGGMNGVGFVITSPLASTSAPFARRRDTMLSMPFNAATWSAVWKNWTGSDQTAMMTHRRGCCITKLAHQIGRATLPHLVDRVDQLAIMREEYSGSSSFPIVSRIMEGRVASLRMKRERTCVSSKMHRIDCAVALSVAANNVEKRRSSKRETYFGGQLPESGTSSSWSSSRTASSMGYTSMAFVANGYSRSSTSSIIN